LTRYECPGCHHRWVGRSRSPGGRVHCPRCGVVVRTYAKAVRPMKEVIQ